MAECRQAPAAAAPPVSEDHASARVIEGDAASVQSVEKDRTRKPYTITKTRERWTDAEHERFLQAMRLFGRKWAKVAEHIGTKTTVQIRSHAQKYFNRVAKKRADDGIDFPPPRPKRKAGQGAAKQATGSQPQQQPSPLSPARAPEPQPSQNNPAPAVFADRVTSMVAAAASAAAAAAAARVVAAAGEKIGGQLRLEMARLMLEQASMRSDGRMYAPCGLESILRAQQHAQLAMQPALPGLEATAAWPLAAANVAAAWPNFASQVHDALQQQCRPKDSPPGQYVGDSDITARDAVAANQEENRSSQGFSEANPDSGEAQAEANALSGSSRQLETAKHKRRASSQANMECAEPGATAALISSNTSDEGTNPNAQGGKSAFEQSQALPRHTSPSHASMQMKWSAPDGSVGGSDSVTKPLSVAPSGAKQEDKPPAPLSRKRGLMPLSQEAAGAAAGARDADGAPPAKKRNTDGEGVHAQSTNAHLNSVNGGAGAARANDSNWPNLAHPHGSAWRLHTEAQASILNSVSSAASGATVQILGHCAGPSPFGAPGGAHPLDPLARARAMSAGFGLGTALNLDPLRAAPGHPSAVPPALILQEHIDYVQAALAGGVSAGHVLSQPPAPPAATPWRQPTPPPQLQQSYLAAGGTAALQSTLRQQPFGQLPYPLGYMHPLSLPHGFPSSGSLEGFFADMASADPAYGAAKHFAAHLPQQRP